MEVLAGDVGGTKTRLARVQVGEGFLRVLDETEFPSADYAHLSDVLTDYFRRSPGEVMAAAFGVPGPVFDGQARMTNLPWELSASELVPVLGAPQVSLINDLEATAHGIGELDSHSLQTLAPGVPDAQGNAALIAPGTGLGEAGLYWDGTRFRPFATEGGHADFAPADATDYALHSHLAERFDHVSWEKVLSGPGLVNVHEFLRSYRESPLPDWLTKEMEGRGQAAAITNAAEGRSCPVCCEAMDRFVGYFGAEAGNLALKLMAFGGIYLGGGIVPRIEGRLLKPDFLVALRNKGRLGTMLEQIPVRLIRDDRAALLGAARFAALAEAQ